MFVFYYAVLGQITPPLAGAAYAAAPIAGETANRVGWTAFAIGLPIYILPFMFYFSPAIIMQGPPLEIAFAAMSALVGVFCVAAGVVGYLRGPLAMAWRLALICAGTMLMHSDPWSDIAGLTVLATAWFFGVRQSQPKLQ